MAQIGTVKVETAGGPVELPVYELGDSGSNRVEAFRVQTASGPGFVPLTDVSAADRPYLRVQTGNGVKAFDTSASGIPDSAVSRPNDDDLFNNVNRIAGIQISTFIDFPAIDLEISALASGAELVKISRDSDGQVMGSADITGLTDGDIVRIDLDSNLAAGETYNIETGFNVSSYTKGFKDERDGDVTLPIVSNDGNIQIDDGRLLGGTHPNMAYFVSVGNLS